MKCFYFCVVVALSFAVVTMVSCTPAAQPMSVKMVHPDTHQTLTCSASDQLGRSDTALLARAVESCVNSLKARGFVVE